MFKKLFKKSKEDILEIHAPLNGKLIPLEDVPDPVFSEKMMGEGIAIKPEDGLVLSPVKGKIILVPKTKHAVGIEAEDGSEILIHVGLETVALKGEGFSTSLRIGDQVEVGDQLIAFDLDYITEEAKDSITPILITNSLTSNKNYSLTEERKAKAGKTVIITISK